VEVDRVAHRTVVAEGDGEQVAHLAAQDGTGERAVEHPHLLGDAGCDLHDHLVGGEGELVLGAARGRGERWIERLPLGLGDGGEVDLGAGVGSRFCRSLRCHGRATDDDVEHHPRLLVPRDRAPRLGRPRERSGEQLRRGAGLEQPGPADAADGEVVRHGSGVRDVEHHARPGRDVDRRGLHPQIAELDLDDGGARRRIGGRRLGERGVVAVVRTPAEGAGGGHGERDHPAATGSPPRPGWMQNSRHDGLISLADVRSIRPSIERSARGESPL
jgi:hypothetical protein